MTLMTEASASTPAKLVPGLYYLVPTSDEDWFVIDPSHKRLFDDEIFDRADQAAHALITRAVAEGLDYAPQFSRDTGEVLAVRVGPRPRRLLLKLALPPKVSADLDELADDLMTTRSGVILKAIALLKLATEAKQKGKRVAILDDRDNSEQDITGF
jgi:hypothetical protein